MSRLRQSCIGMALAALILAAWLALHVAAVFMVVPESSAAVTLALVLALTWLSVGLFIVSHDAMHGSLCPSSRAAGDLAGAVALLLYAGFSYRCLQPKHHAHHRSPGSAEDPDFAAATPARALPWFRQFMTTYFRGRELAVMVARVGLYLLLGARVQNIALFFALPALLSSLQLFYFGTFRPHRHLAGAPTEFADHHRARSNEYGTLLSLLTCFHFGYHHEHHLQPGAPWWRLPALRARHGRRPA